MVDIGKIIEKELAQIQNNKPTIVFSESEDPRVLEAVCYLTRFCRPVFLKKQEDVKKIFEKNLPSIDNSRVDYTLSQSAFVDISKEKELLEELASLFLQTENKFAGGKEEALEILKDPAMFAIYLVKAGYADMVVGGALYEPMKFLRPALKALKTHDIQCEAGLFFLPDEANESVFPNNIAVFGDVGVNTQMTPETLATVAVGTSVIARDLIPESVLPQINGAIVSYSNRGSDEGPSPELVRKAAEYVPKILSEQIKRDKRYETINIVEEVKVSAVLSKRSAGSYSHSDKNMEKLAGQFNVIIAPNLELGNFLFHFYSARFPQAKKLTAIYGARFRVIDLALDCSAEDVVLTVKANLLRHFRFGKWYETPKDLFFKRYKVLAINPGSTSTKIAFYEGETEKWVEEIRHSAEELKPFAGRPLVEQGTFRKEIILKAMKDKGVKVEDLDGIAARGGLLDPISSGTYEISDKMIEHLKSAKNGEHASNLGAIIAKELTEGTKVRCYIVDPVVVDELPERVKITGLKEMRRKSISHALNQIASARRYAEENETFYEKINVIVCHMGGGISIGAHKRGRYIDVNNALDGEGPFSPERSGSLPVGDLINLCFSGKYTKQELKVLNKGRGGMISLLGTSDLREIEKRIAEGDKEAENAFEAMAYQISKEITSRIPAFDGESIDQIILTGGMARSKLLTEKISNYVSPVKCGVTVYAGENEMFALTKGVLRVLSGRAKAKSY